VGGGEQKKGGAAEARSRFHNVIIYNLNE
jgi:hypothetical protein